jgi:hypothetical protein
MFDKVSTRKIAHDLHFRERRKRNELRREAARRREQAVAATPDQRAFANFIEDVGVAHRTIDGALGIDRRTFPRARTDRAHEFCRFSDAEDANGIDARREFGQLTGDGSRFEGGTMCSALAVSVRTR